MDLTQIIHFVAIIFAIAGGVIFFIIIISNEEYKKGLLWFGGIMLFIGLVGIFATS